MNKTIFCANDQVETAHVLSASDSGEIQATCGVCGRVLKFSRGITKDNFDEQVDAHEVANAGQVTQESIDKILSELADDTTPAVQEDTTPVEDTPPVEG